MAIRRKQNSEEKLDDVSIERVIKHLEDKKTKKDACRILNISYNVARLDKIIETYLERKATDARLRAEKRGKPAAPDEVAYIVKEYLQGDTLDNISNSLHRGTTLVKKVLEEHAVPLRSSSQDYFNPQLIPDAAVRERFNIGETVYSARYESLAKIRNELKQEEGYVYGIYLLDEKYNEYAYQPAWELASLQKLRDAGVNL